MSEKIHIIYDKDIPHLKAMEVATHAARMYTNTGKEEVGVDGYDVELSENECGLWIRIEEKK